MGGHCWKGFAREKVAMWPPIAICTPLMSRVHEHVQAGELVYFG